jgi:hypothetical protein
LSLLNIGFTSVVETAALSIWDTSGTEKKYHRFSDTPQTVTHVQPLAVGSAFAALRERDSHAGNPLLLLPVAISPSLHGAAHPRAQKLLSRPLYLAQCTTLGLPLLI